MSMGQAEKTKIGSDLRAGDIQLSATSGCDRRTAFTAAICGVAIACSMMLGVNARADSSTAAVPSLQQSTKGATVELDVANANLISVVRLLQAQTGTQIVVVNGDYSPVTATVTAPLADALRYVASSANATVTCDSNGVYTFRPGVDSAPSAAVQQPAPIVAAVTAEDAIPQSALKTERIPLQNVDPNYVLIMLGETQGIRQSDPASNPINNSPMTRPSMGAHITAGPPAIVIQNRDGSSPTQSQEPSVPSGNGAYANSIGSQANDSVSGFGSDQAGQYPGGGFRPGGGAGGAGGFPGAGGAGGAGAGTPGLPGTPGAQSNLRPEGIKRIIANEEDNSLIVQGTAEGISELKNIINFLDRAPKQVQIKVEFVTANVADADTFGINWDMIPLPNVHIGFNGPAISSTEGSTYMTFAQGNLVAQLEGLLSNSKGKVIAAPTITTTNNTPGIIEFSDEVPYETTTTVAQAGGNAVSGTTVNFLNITNELDVTPRINGDDSVSLLLEPQLQTPGTPPFTGGPPPVSTEAVETYRTVANGDTMVIGGLVNKQSTNSQFRVPFLSDLPIIGSLFRTRTLNTSDTELLIFVTPTVLPPIGADLGAMNANTASSMNQPLGAGTGASQYGVTP